MNALELDFMPFNNWRHKYSVRENSVLHNKFRMLYESFYQRAFTKKKDQDKRNVPTFSELHRKPSYINHNEGNKYYYGLCDTYLAVSIKAIDNVMEGEPVGFMCFHAFFPKENKYEKVTREKRKRINPLSFVNPPPFVYIAHFCSDERFKGIGSRLMAFINNLEEYQNSYFILEMDEGKAKDLTDKYIKNPYNFMPVKGLKSDDPMRSMINYVQIDSTITLANVSENHIFEIISKEDMPFLSKTWLVRMPMSMHVASHDLSKKFRYLLNELM